MKGSSLTVRMGAVKPVTIICNGSAPVKLLGGIISSEIKELHEEKDEG